MNDWYIHYRLGTQRWHDRQLEAEAYRLARFLSPERPARLRIYQRVLMFLGGLMENWGCRIRSHYENIAIAGVAETGVETSISTCSG